MWKLYTDTNMTFDKKAKELNPRYTFFSQPRFFVKLDELREFQTSFSEKGNIVMLNLQGNKIVGKNGFAIAQNNTVSWWAKKSKGISEIMEYLNKIAEEREKEK